MPDLEVAWNALPSYAGLLVAALPGEALWIDLSGIKALRYKIICCVNNSRHCQARLPHHCKCIWAGCIPVQGCHTQSWASFPLALPPMQRGC